LPLAFNRVLCFDTACRGAGAYVTAVLIVICAARFESVGSGADCARIVALPLGARIARRDVKSDFSF